MRASRSCGQGAAGPWLSCSSSLLRFASITGQCWRPEALLAVEHRPADVVPQPLVVEYELADRLRELVALPPALESPCALALSFRRGGTRRLDRIGGRTELVRRYVCDDRRLAGGVRSMAWRPTQISGRGHCMASCRACLGHGDLAARPGPPEFDRATRSQVLRPSRLEEVQDVFRARCRPQGEEIVIRISEGPTAADRHETRVAFFREDQPSTSPARICLTSTTMSPPLQERIHSGRRSCLHLTDNPSVERPLRVCRPY